MTRKQDEERRERRGDERRRRRQESTEGEDTYPIDSEPKETESKEEDAKEDGKTRSNEEEKLEEKKQSIQRLPQISFSFSLSPNNKDLEFSIPEIGKRSALGTPDFTVSQTPIIRGKSLSKKIPNPQSTKVIEVIQFEVSNSPNPRAKTLDTDNPSVSQYTSGGLIPQPSISSFNRPRAKKLNDEKLTVLPSPKEERVTRKTEVMMGREPAGEGGGATAEEIPDPLEIVFGPEGSELLSERPVLIDLYEPEDDKFLGSLETICKRIYREKTKSKQPTSVKIGDLDELKDETRWLKAEGNILTIDLKEEWEKLRKTSANEEKRYRPEALKEDKEEASKNELIKRLSRRIDQMFSQGIGFVILRNRPSDVDIDFKVRDHRIKHIQLTPEKKEFEKIHQISRTFWGYSQPDPDEVETIIPHFDNIFGFYSEDSRNGYRAQLRDAAEADGGIYLDATDAQENESTLHRLLKSLMVKIEAERIRNTEGIQLKTPMEIEGKIKTEDEIRIDDNNIIRPDIRVGSIAIEVETLFSEDREGRNPRDKLKETFKKYEDTNEVTEVKIILDTFTMANHLKTVSQLKQNFRDWEESEKGVEFNFYTIDLGEGELIQYSEYVKRLRETT